MTVRKAENFRESLPSANDRGKRLWIYPKMISGAFYKYRKIISYFQLGFLFSAPFIKLNGYPLLMFNIVERKFSIFGKVFWPQDFFIFVLAMITFFVGIFLFTTIYGRVWCGWLCPQTIFMEMLFRRIEYFIEGDRNKYVKRQKNGYSKADRIRMIIKHTIFFAVSFFIGNLLLAYIIGGDGLIDLISDGLTAHPGGLAAMIIFSLLFYWLYAYFREQFCCFICPYARLQSVMFDDNTISVIYDHKRGEPRTKKKKSADLTNAGDCIDCGLCQKVCPTGIDIRDAFPQLECINCTACIDACNGIMKKVGHEQNLIRFHSKSGVESGKKFSISPRIVIYTIIVISLFIVVNVLVHTRTDTDSTILRDKEQIPQLLATGEVSNLYRIKILNKSKRQGDINLRLISHDGSVTILGPLELKPEALSEAMFIVKIDQMKLNRNVNDITIELLQDGNVIESVDSKFTNRKE